MHTVCILKRMFSIQRSSIRYRWVVEGWQCWGSEGNCCACETLQSVKQGTAVHREIFSSDIYTSLFQDSEVPISTQIKTLWWDGNQSHSVSSWFHYCWLYTTLYTPHRKSEISWLSSSAVLLPGTGDVSFQMTSKLLVIWCEIHDFQIHELQKSQF